MSIQPESRRYGSKNVSRTTRIRHGPTQITLIQLSLALMRRRSSWKSSSVNCSAEVRFLLEVRASLKRFGGRVATN